MYRAYNLVLSEDSIGQTYRQRGDQRFRATSDEVEPKLREFLLSDNVVDATKLQDAWFPAVDADVFISYSSADRELALRLAGWLEKKFGLTVFLDMAVWGHGSNLLHQLDEKYCKIDHLLYSYEKCARSSSHVWLMVATALTRMMDRAEVVLFLNTPSSISPSGVIGNDDRTLSPWLHHELTMMNLLRRRQPDREMVKVAKMRKAVRLDEMVGAYAVDLSPFPKVVQGDLNAWDLLYDKLGDKFHSLDLLDLVASIRG